MSILQSLNPLGWIQAAAKPISDVMVAKTKRKENLETAQAKIAMNKQEGSQQLELNDDEWEALSVKQNPESWKDEYITIIITFPLITVFIATFWSVYSGNSAAQDAADASIDSIIKLLPNYPFIAMSVILAAVGIKAVSRGFK